jgi:soluble lytic murein transglycosylase-like protein
LALALCCALAPVAAAAAEGRGDFTFRRIRPPEPGQGGPRITVQIDPVEQRRLLAASPAVPPRPAMPFAVAPPPGAPQEARYGWFWELVPPALGAVEGRFGRALAALAGGPGGARVAAPRLQHLQAIAGRHGAEILRATIGTEVSPALVLAVIGVESAGRADAVSRAGALGLMQLIPATAERFGVADAFDPAQNIRGGVAYLDWLMRHFDRDPLMVLAAYNAGEGAVRRHGGVPPFAETRDYVPKVLAAWQVAQGLCATPPELVSDPCVFRIIAAGATAHAAP